MTKQIHFYKYQGTGNDFVITSDIFDITKEQIQALCNRKYGIGSDGLIVMRKESKFDFEMIYYNADGSESFCGNGSRCAVMHAKSIGWITNDCTFGSNDGPHEARIEDEIVFLKMHNVDMVLVEDEGYMLNTGSPHYIAYTEEIDALDLIEAAHAIRYSERFEETGINVNYLPITLSKTVALDTSHKKSKLREDHSWFRLIKNQSLLKIYFYRDLQ
jgi:diaminopimelate epimerase